MAIKGIIFDCFGVLIRSGHNVLRQDFPELGNYVDELQKRSDYGVLTREQFNKEVAARTGLKPIDIDERYWGTNKYDNSVLDIAEKFHKSGRYKVGLLSNIGRDWMNEAMAVFIKRDLFDEVIFSGDINIVKPDPKIFKLMAQKLELKPEECVMIDDRPENINGARIAGMHGIVFFSAQQLMDDINNLLDINNA